MYSASLPSYIPKKEKKGKGVKPVAKGKTEKIQGGLQGLIGKLQTLR